MPKIKISHPVGIAGAHHPAGAVLEVGTDVDAHDARFLVGIGKAKHLHDSPVPNKIRTQEVPVENADPRAQKTRNK